MMNVVQLMSDGPVDRSVDNRPYLLKTLALSTGSLSPMPPAALPWGRRVDSQTMSDLQKRVLTHNPQALQHLLPFISLSLLNRTGSSL